jgi:hypothetical protein
MSLDTARGPEGRVGALLLKLIRVFREAGVMEGGLVNPWTKGRRED